MAALIDACTQTRITDQLFGTGKAGDLTVRNKGLSTAQTLTWSHENRLATLTATGVSESYLYDADGQRVRKTSGGVTTYYPFPHYEVSGSTTTKYYFFNGQRVAMKVGSTLTYLYGDHLSSTALSTTNGAFSVGQGYYGYGNYRTGGSLPTNYRYTDQELDIATGLMYYDTRFYDRVIGQFISPDTLVPDPSYVYDYNRYAYGRGNPLKFNDPSGHCAVSESDPDASDCRRWANTIYASWDHTDYWNRMWLDGKDFFLENVATQPIQAEYFQNEFARYQQSDEFKAWHAELAKHQQAPASGQQLHPVDAIAVGVGMNSDFPLLGAFALSGGVGVEILAHNDGTMALFVYGGGGGSLGVGANATIYTARVRDLPTINNYAGGSMAGDLTVVPGIGLTMGEFNAPEGGAYGEKYGLGLGANISAGGGYTHYSKPLISYNLHTGQFGW